MTEPSHAGLNAYALTRGGYFADFVTMPLGAAALVAGELLIRGPGLAFALAVLAGWILWTAFEYALHRWLFHSATSFGRAHHVHHVRPAALIGVASWYTLAIFAALYAALVLLAGWSTGGGITLGFVAGYLAYIGIHYAIHHVRIGPGHPLYAAKLRHLAHHRGADGNYGVIVRWWDAVFRTLR